VLLRSRKALVVLLSRKAPVVPLSLGREHCWEEERRTASDRRSGESVGSIAMPLPRRLAEGCCCCCCDRSTTTLTTTTHWILMLRLLPPWLELYAVHFYWSGLGDLGDRPKKLAVRTTILLLGTDSTQKISVSITSVWFPESMITSVSIP